MKNVMIFGDSYSTFRGHIPEGYAVYYSEKDRPETDVRSVEQTWWYPMLRDMGVSLVLNNSWSGSTLCYTGYGQSDCSKTSSFIHRLDVLIEEGFFEKNEIDTVFIFGCTNDSWANSPLGDIKLEGQTEEELFCVCPAIAYFIGKVRATLPEARVIFIINTDLKPEIGEAVKAASEHFGTEYIELKYIDKRCGHPTIKGMSDIREQIEGYLKSR